MTLAVIYSRALNGIAAPLVTVEVHLSNGLPSLSIVGLPEAAVKESKDRVRAALLNAHFDFPPRRITVNLAPADLPKEGGRYDLPIAIGILAASGQIPADRLQHYEFAGELALTGVLRPIRGTLILSLQARGSGRTLILPHDNGSEAALVTDVAVLSARHLIEVCQHLHGTKPLTACVSAPITTHHAPANLDLEDVRGQHHAKRALQIAAAGNHNLLMLGPPGSGKTMLASRLTGILPVMNDDEALEAAAISSISDQGFDVQNWRKRPFRAPHHTASGVALVGGGSHPRPGEISLAHRGVLFLDELPEFDRRVLEVLREPLESGRIIISRAARQAEFPASFQLIAAMNPCPCGYLGDTSGRCHCTIEQVQRYRARISGPLLDRIDMHIEVPAVSQQVLRSSAETGLDSAAIRAGVIAARQRQLQRAGKLNQALSSREVEVYCPLASDVATLLDQAVSRLGLSARAYHRVLKVARTIADLAHSPSIEMPHISEAISYRRLDRQPATSVTIKQ